MSEFLSKNAPLIIAVVGVLLTIIIQWDVITKRIGTFADTIDTVPFTVFKLLAISFSGTFVVSIFWIAIDYLTVGRLQLPDIMTDIANGASWGIPLALLSAILSKDLEGAVVSGILFSIIILLIGGPDKIIHPAQVDFYQKKFNSVVLLSVVAIIGVMCSYAGFKTRAFIDRISTKSSKS